MCPAPQASCGPHCGPALTQAGSRTLDCRAGATGASTKLCLVEHPPSGLPETAVFPDV